MAKISGLQRRGLAYFLRVNAKIVYKETITSNRYGFFVVKAATWGAA